MRGGAAAPAAGGGTGGGGDPDPPPPPPPTMPFADENGVDTDDVTTRADGIKVPYCKSDPVWFRRLEIQMQIRKIKSQFWKRVVLEANLPPELNEQIKDYLILEESEATTVYKDCKARLLKINHDQAQVTSS